MKTKKFKLTRAQEIENEIFKQQIEISERQENITEILNAAFTTLYGTK